MSTTVERLSAVLDYNSQASVYTFATGTEFDQSYSLSGATVAVAGRDYGYDSLLANPAPVAPRKTSWTFHHVYAPGETYDTLKDAMTLAFGHGRPIYLQKTRPDGNILIAEARLDTFPDKATISTTFLAEFTVTFQQRGDWASKDVTSPRYDTGLHYDASIRYDQRGQVVLFTGAVTNFTLTNSGTVADRDLVIKLEGPATGPIYLTNNTCDVRGVPFPVGVAGTPMTLTLFPLGDSLASGEYLQIDCRTNAITSNHNQLGPITVTSGGGYTTPPTGVAFSGGGGSGATATVQTQFVGGGYVVTGVTLTSPGVGYTSLPTISFTGGVGAAAFAAASFAPIVPWTVVAKAPGQHFYFEVVPGANGCTLQKADGAAAGDLYIQFRSRWRS